MPLLSWLKSWSGEGPPPEKSESVMVAESLIMELEYQMREVEHLEQEKKHEERKKERSVDYSWLVGVKKKSYEMPQLERLELEELCMKVKPCECGRIITMFRDNLLREPSVEEVPRMLRAVVVMVLDGRPKEDTIPEWLSKSFTRLRPSSRVSISPITQDDLEMQAPTNLDGSNSVVSLFTKSHSIDQLPV